MRRHRAVSGREMVVTRRLDRLEVVAVASRVGGGADSRVVVDAGMGIFR